MIYIQLTGRSLVSRRKKNAAHVCLSGLGLLGGVRQRFGARTGQEALKEEGPAEQDLDYSVKRPPPAHLENARQGSIATSTVAVRRVGMAAVCAPLAPRHRRPGS